MAGFGLGEAIRLKEITSDQDARWALGNFFVTFWLPKTIVVDADEIFAGILRNNFQETLLIPVHTVARGKHKAVINEGFHRYLNRVKNIKSADKGSLHQWFQGVLFALFDWNAGPVDGTNIA